MSYSEENGQVVLRMSKEDYERILFRLAAATARCHWRFLDKEMQLLNRINEGNPNYTPYQVEK
jgi:hypothetical protein